MAGSRRLQVQRRPPTPVPTSSSGLNRERTAKIARLEQNERNRDGRLHAGFRPRQLGPVKAKFLADAACNARIKDLVRSAERNFRLPPFVMDYHHDWALPSHARLAFRPDDRGLSLGHCTALSAAGPGQIVW